MATGIEPATASSLNWCSTVELTSPLISGQNPCPEQTQPNPVGWRGCRWTETSMEHSFKETPVGVEPTESGFASRRHAV